jgi:DNA-binding GntR family transcriptional regulator
MRHKAILQAALARHADLAVDLLTQHLETTARHLGAIAPEVGATDPATLDAPAG